MSLYQTHIHSLGNDPLVMQVATTANGVLDARIKGAQGHALRRVGKKGLAVHFTGLILVPLMR